MCGQYSLCLKLGHYMKIPPRMTFTGTLGYSSSLFSFIVDALVLLHSHRRCRRSHQSGSSRHEVTTIQIRREHLQRDQLEPSHLSSSKRLLHRLGSLVRLLLLRFGKLHHQPANLMLLTSHCRGLIGPRRQFGAITSLYHPAFFSFLVGAILPVPFWYYSRKVRILRSFSRRRPADQSPHSPFCSIRRLG
jgi:hypothetical protein